VKITVVKVAGEVYVIRRGRFWKSVVVLSGDAAVFRSGPLGMSVSSGNPGTAIRALEEAGRGFGGTAAGAVRRALERLRGQLPVC
jgi:hypothetical protein